VAPDAENSAPAGATTGSEPAVSNIMPEPGQHGWAELLTLVDFIRCQLSAAA
jgi:hypothetical protein